MDHARPVCRPHVIILYILMALAAAVLDARGATVLWDAGSGALPDSSCPSWTAAVGDSAPTIVSGALRIKTTACSRSTYYLQVSPDIQIPDTLVVEARLRLQTGTECQGPCGHYRQGAGIAITVAPQVGTLFFVGNDEVFITTSECGGIASAAVDTNDQAHTYRIVVLPGGSVSVQYDGAPILSGHTYSSASDHGSNPRILWGEGSYLAYGTSYWEYVRHNAHATGCVPMSVDASGPGSPTGASLHARAFPNPFATTTTLRCEVARPGPIRLDLFDASGTRVRSLLRWAGVAGEQVIDWDGRDDAGHAVAGGPYLFRITTREGAGSGKVLRIP